MVSLLNKIFLFAIVFSLAACGPVAPAATASQPTAAQATATLAQSTPAAPGEFPTGSFGTTTAEDEYLIKFENNGTYTVYVDGDLIGEGQYVVTGDQVTFEDDTEACAGLGAGLYTWTYAEGHLSFIAIDEPCAEREAVLSNGLTGQRPG